MNLTIRAGSGEVRGMFAVIEGGVKLGATVTTGGCGVATGTAGPGVAGVVIEVTVGAGVTAAWVGVVTDAIVGAGVTDA